MKNSKILRADLKSILPMTDNYEWNELKVRDVWNEYNWFTLNIGIQGKEASDIFDVLISTPRAQGRARRENNIKQCFIVERFDRRTIENSVTQFVERITGMSWMDIVDQLREKINWEYEGMG